MVTERGKPDASGLVPLAAATDEHVEIIEV
jgi:hypothetical protein